MIKMKIVRWLIPTFAVSVAYITMFWYQFWFKEQSTIFLFSQGFYSLPGELSAYLGGFITQFCKTPAIGGLILVFSFAFSWWIYRKILIVDYQTDNRFLAFYPVVYLMGLFSLVNYHFSLVCAHCLVSLSVWLYINIHKTCKRYILGFILIFLMYRATNTIFYTGSVLFIMHELCRRRQKYFIVVVITYALLSLSLPELTYRLFSLPYEECYFSGNWILETIITARDVKMIYPSLAIFPLICFCAYLSNVFSIKFGIFGKLIRPLIPVLLFVGLFIVGRNLQQETKCLKSLHLLRNEKWEEMIIQVQKKEKPVFVEMLLYNFALAHETALPKSLLFDQRNSINYYRTEMLKGIFQHSFTSEIYFHTGFVNRAYYDYFNMNKSLDRYASAYCLNRMAYIQMVKGNYPLAAKYYTILSKTIFYSREAGEKLHLLAHPALIEQDVAICEKRKLMEHDDFFWNEQLLANLVNYADMGTDNRLASEYLIGFILLSADLPHLMKYLEPVLAKYYAESCIPDIYQQAVLCCYSEYLPSKLEEFDISEKNKQLYEYYVQDMNSAMLIPERMKKYEGTYFYYLIER